MSGLAAGWLGRLRPELAGYAGVALDNIGREFPAYISSTMTAPGDFPFRPSDRNPVFYGSLDWHSCVEMFWLLVRLLKTGPWRRAWPRRSGPPSTRGSRPAACGPRRTSWPPRTARRWSAPYGWGWALALAAELESWDDPDARRWAAALRPLSVTLEQNFLRWLALATYPLRTGRAYQQCVRDIEGAAATRTCSRTASSAGRCAAPAEPLVRRGRGLSRAAGSRPASDFLSPALCEAELLAPAAAARGLPRLARALSCPASAQREPAALFTPAVVTDSSDGYIAHLRGLNLSRRLCAGGAWPRASRPAIRGLTVCAQASAVHAEASLAYVTGDDYMVEHWLAAYAVLLFS